MKNALQAGLCLVLLVSSALVVGTTPTVAQSAVSTGCFSQVKWNYCYTLDDSRGQGLELRSVSFDGTFIFYNIGFPFSMTRYEGGGFGSPFKDILGTTSSTVVGYGAGAMTLSSADCPGFLGSGTLYGNSRICVEQVTASKDPHVFIWSKFNIYNYRFIQGYELHQDGTFIPKVFLGGNLIDQGTGSCTQSNGGTQCRVHQHYLYWRMDIDMNYWTNDKFQEFKKVAATTSNQNADTACPGTSFWCTHTSEVGLDRNYAQFTKWRTVDFSSLNGKSHPKSIEIMSNSQGPVDSMSTNDVWAVRYKGTCVSNACEMGYQVPKNPTTDAGVNGYISGESINGADVVVWYSEKVHHEPRDEELSSMALHEAGPLIRVRNVSNSNPGPASYP